MDDAYSKMLPRMRLIILDACDRAANPKLKRLRMRKRCHTRITEMMCNYIQTDEELKQHFNTWGHVKVFDNNENEGDMDLVGYILHTPRSYTDAMDEYGHRKPGPFPTYITLFDYQYDTGKLSMGCRQLDFEQRLKFLMEMLDGFHVRMSAYGNGWFNNA